jgi:hypothetical protein
MNLICDDDDRSQQDIDKVSGYRFLSRGKHSDGQRETENMREFIELFIFIEQCEL